MKIRRNIRNAANRQGRSVTLARGASIGQYTVRGNTLDTHSFHARSAAPVSISQAAATNAVSSVHVIPTGRAAHRWVQENQSGVLKHRGKWVAITEKGPTGS